MHHTHEKGGKLKVLLLESSPHWGGQEDRLVREAVWLKDRGHDVVVACEKGAAIAARAMQAGLDVRATPMRSNADMVGLLRLRKLYRKVKPHLIHARSPKDAWLAFWFHLCGMPVVRSRHTTLPAHMPWRRSFIYRHGCRRLIASASFIAEDMRSSIGVSTDRIDIIGESVDVSEFCPGDGSAFRREFGIPEAAPLFGIVAMLRGEKGHDVFLRAAKIVADQKPAARFVIVGDAASRDRVKTQIEETLQRDFGSERNKSVIVTGFRSDIPRVMRALDCLVVPSKREAQTLVIPQAFATGKPVIGSRVGGIPELVKNGVNGLLFDCGDHLALAAAMTELIDSPQKAEAFGRAGRELAEQELAIDRKMELLVNSYRKCVANR